MTALKIQKRNHQRVNVYLDGEFAFGIAKILAVELRIGQELDAKKIEELQSKDNYETALQKALRLVSYRPRSSTEIRKNLQKNSIADPIIESVLARLSELGVINDLQFAQKWVENRNELKPRGITLLRRELQEKGITRNIIDQVLEHQEEEHLAYQYAQTKAPKYQHLDYQTYRTKMYGVLARRGFAYDTIIQVVQQVWEECEIQQDHSSSYDDL